MQPVLERGSIDELLTFDVGLIQLSFHTHVFTQYMQRCFQSKCYNNYFRQIVQRVCTLVLFIIFVIPRAHNILILLLTPLIYYHRVGDSISRDERDVPLTQYIINA